MALSSYPLFVGVELEEIHTYGPVSSLRLKLLHGPI